MPGVRTSKGAYLTPAALGMRSLKVWRTFSGRSLAAAEVASLKVCAVAAASFIFPYERVSFSFHDLPLFLLFSRPTCSPSLHRSSVSFPLLGVVALHTFIISSADAPRSFLIKTSFNNSCSTVLAARSLPSYFCHLDRVVTVGTMSRHKVCVEGAKRTPKR